MCWAWWYLRAPPRWRRGVETCLCFPFRNHHFSKIDSTSHCMAGRVRCLYRGARAGCMRGQLHQGKSEQLRWMIACCVRHSAPHLLGDAVSEEDQWVDAVLKWRLQLQATYWWSRGAGFAVRRLVYLLLFFSGFAKLTHKLALRWVESRSQCGLNKFLLMPLFWIVLHLFDCSGGWIPEIDSRCRWKYISCFRAPSIGPAQLSFVKKKSLDSNICSTWYFSRLQGPKG